MTPDPPSTVQPEPPSQTYKYWGFISYSHADEAFAKRLQRNLETYRIPKQLVGRIVRGERIPARLFPVFLDREELSGAADLGAEIRQQLERSRTIVVVCSTSAARSQWVDEEIRYFKSLGRSERVLCVIAEEQPYTESTQATMGADCFPPSVRFDGGLPGRLSQARVEPMAADARPRGDGWKNANLKLIAGILDLEFDDVRQRDQHRQRMRRIQSAVLTASVLLFAAFGYVLLSDAGAPLPGAGQLQRRLDRHEMTWSRPVHEASEVQATAVRLRTTLVRELLGRWRRGLWYFPVVDPTAKEKTLLDVWLAAQSATGVLRTGGSLAAESAAEIVSAFDAAFAPGVPVEIDGQLLGWRVGHYLPSASQQVIGSETAIGAELWLSAGLAVVLSRDGLIPEANRPQYLARVALAQRSAERYYGEGGGWNFFPNQLEPEQHSTYASLLALLSLLETRKAGLPWNGSIETRDARLRSTAAWLIDHFEAAAEPAGWSGAPGDTGGTVDGLTLQAYAELLRSEAEAGIGLPEPMLRAIQAHVVSLVDRGTDYPITNRTFFRPYRRADGSLGSGSESLYFVWHPWAVEACVWWIRRLERHGGPREDIVAARRALGHLVVDLGAEMVDKIIGGITFPIAESAYTLAIVEAR